MASPQLENGYTKIANEILEALARIRIAGEAGQVFYFILRKTYGFNKKADPISLSQFSLGTGLKKNTICKAINKLKELNLITNKGNDLATIYSINKDFSTWKALPKKGTLPIKGKVITNKGNKRYQYGDIQKKVLKETITKEISEQSSQSQKLFQLFYNTINPNINFANKTERAAAEWLINRYGLEKVISAAEYAISVQNDKYAPTITTPLQLKDKMAALAKHKGSKEQPKQGKVLIL